MAADIATSLFIDPEPAQIEASASLGVDIVEIHTGDYAEAEDDASRERELERLEIAANQAAAASLVVAAGHGLDYVNVRDVVAIAEIEELNIGHSIVARSIFVGFDQAVREMLALMNERS